jgi:hypothetical protein
MEETVAPGWGRALGAALAGLFTSWVVAGLLAFVAALMAGAALADDSSDGEDGLGELALIIVIALAVFLLGYLLVAGVVVPVMTKMVAHRHLSFGAGVLAALVSAVAPAVGFFVQQDQPAALSAAVGVGQLLIAIVLPAWVIRTLAKPIAPAPTPAP